MRSRALGRAIAWWYLPLKQHVMQFLVHILGSSAMDYLKILISFVQISNTFETNFIFIRWPHALASVWALGRFLRFDLKFLPGLGCLTAQYSYAAMQQLRVALPLAVSGAIALPVLWMWARGERGRPLFKAVSDRMWYCLMFWLFLMYPGLTVLSVEGYDCVPVGGAGAPRVLVADVGQACPLDAKRSALFGWLVAATCLFPLGIPALMLAILWRFGVPRIARRKRDKAVLHCMLEACREHLAHTATGRLAAYVGMGEHSEGPHHVRAAKPAVNVVVQERARQMFLGAVKRRGEHFLRHASRLHDRDRDFGAPRGAGVLHDRL